jgi:predicted GTPase
MEKKNVIIIGAAGRDFHNFNTCYRDNEAYNVAAFTAAQIPDIFGRVYPAELAGKLYPKGIPIRAEEELPQLIKEMKIDDCVFSYSDVSFHHVMTVGAIVNAAGANFLMLGPKDTMLRSGKPVVAIGAVRTGAGKSQTSRRVIEILHGTGLRVVAVRHPMPYGNLLAEKVVRFAELGDLKKNNCTIEEMEEYEPHIVRGNVIYAGVDYRAILDAAEKDAGGCDLILWEGGNNDFPFFKPDLMVTVADPLRPGHELTYYPGAITLRIADVVVINKIDSADPDNVQKVRESIAKVNAKATVVEAASPIRVDKPEVIRGKRVLAIEDGPTLTHGEMKTGAATIAAQMYGAAALVDPRPYAVGRMAETFKIYPNIGTLLPAMGYGDQQLKDMETTVNRTDCDSVVVGTPIDLNRIMNIKKPNTRVYYDLQDIGTPNLEEVVARFVEKHNLK